MRADRPEPVKRHGAAAAADRPGERDESRLFPRFLNFGAAPACDRSTRSGMAITALTEGGDGTVPWLLALRADKLTR